MKRTQILKRSWETLWSYKALWIFGVILTLTNTPGGEGSGNGGSGH